VQAADRHQGSDTGVAEEIPDVAPDRALVADRERGQDAGGAASQASGSATSRPPVLGPPIAGV
jgi:hypothetical protein